MSVLLRTTSARGTLLRATVNLPLLPYNLRNITRDYKYRLTPIICTVIRNCLIQIIALCFSR